MTNEAEPSQKTSRPAAAPRPSEGVTLACAVAAAVGLGVAVGIWVNARLTPNSSAVAPQTARLLPDARPSAPTAPAAQPSPCDGCGASSAVEATPARGPADKADESGPKTVAEAPTDGARAAAPDAGVEPRRAEEVAKGSAQGQGVRDSAAVAAASPGPSRPMAYEVGPLPKAGRRAVPPSNVARGAAQSGERAGGAQRPPVPCALYASASALSIRLGGAASLILGGPGAGVRINVSTPDWSALAVIYEGPAGQNGWLKYSVRSVSGRPGLYTVRVSSPCGSQTIPVTVK